MPENMYVIHQSETDKAAEDIKNDNIEGKKRMDEIESFLTEHKIPYKREPRFSDKEMYGEVLTLYDSDGKRQGDIAYGSGMTGYGDTPFEIHGAVSNDLSPDRTECVLSSSDVIERLSSLYEINKEGRFTDTASYASAKREMDRIEDWAKKNGVLYKRTANVDHTSGTIAVYDDKGKYAGDVIYGWFAYGDAERPFEVSEGLSKSMNDVEGYLTADEVIERFEKQIEQTRAPEVVPEVRKVYEALVAADIDGLDVSEPEFTHGEWMVKALTEKRNEITFDGTDTLWISPDEDAISALYASYEYTSLEALKMTKVSDVAPEELAALGDPDVFQVLWALEGLRQRDAEERTKPERERAKQTYTHEDYKRDLGELAFPRDLVYDDDGNFVGIPGEEEARAYYEDIPYDVVSENLCRFKELADEEELS